MFSQIALATARQLRAGTTLVVRTAAATSTSLTTRSAVVFQQRGYASTRSKKAAAESEDTDATTTKPKRTRSAATKSTKSSTTGATKATAKTKTAKAKKEAAPKKPKPLTEEQKRKLKIKALKEQALLTEEPRLRVISSWKLFVEEHIRDLAHPGENIFKSGATRKLSAQFQALSAAERERYEAKVEKERQETAAAHAAWVRTKTPKEIIAANNARHQLKHLGVITRSRVIHDDRIPKAAMNAYMWFFKSRAKEAHLASDHTRVTGITKILAEEWKSMDDAARQPFIDNAKADSERYYAQMAALN